MDSFLLDRVSGTELEIRADLDWLAPAQVLMDIEEGNSPRNSLPPYDPKTLTAATRKGC